MRMNMYKVKPEDVIPTRTDKQVWVQNKTKGGLCGTNKKDVKKGNKLIKQFDAMSKNMTREKIIPMVELAHQITDLGNSKSIENAVCAKGCSHCCQVNVDLNSFEAAYIEIKTGRMVKESVYNLRPGSKLVKYCPFHNAETSLCDIWEFRPVACRGFFAFDDPKLCEGNDKTHAISSAWNVPVTKHIMEVLKTRGGGEVKDIRAYFPYV